MSARILVVDDQEDIVETISFCLEQEGYEVLQAHDGIQALSLAREVEPDLIVLDVMLPGENGYQIARQLREDWQTGKISKRPLVLLLTARKVEKRREDFLQTWSGAESVLYKPFDLEQLMEWIDQLLALGLRDPAQLRTTASSTETRALAASGTTDLVGIDPFQA